MDGAANSLRALFPRVQLSPSITLDNSDCLLVIGSKNNCIHYRSTYYRLVSPGTLTCQLEFEEWCG